MSDRDALLAVICAHPDEDTPRLVFADWLDEHADTCPAPVVARQWAAFIRDDIAMARRDKSDPARLRWERLEKPQREAEGWVNESLVSLPTGCEFLHDPLFRRGFPWAIVMTSYIRSPLPKLPSGSFQLEQIRYNGDGYLGLDQLRTAPWRSRLRSIEFEQGTIPPAQLRRFFAHDGFDRLDRLAFARDAISAAGLRELIALPLFGRLTALVVTRVHTGAAIGAVLAGARGSGLTELQVVGCRLTVPALTELLDSPAARTLESLSVGGDRIAAPGKLFALARATRLPLLRELDVSEDAPNEAGLEALLASPLVTVLERFNLSRCNLNADRTQLLASGTFDNLRVLAINGNAIGNAGAAALARSPHLAGLLVLDLSYSQVGDEGIEAILESPLADGLVLLDLTGSPASAEMKDVLKGRMGDRVRL